MAIGENGHVFKAEGNKVHHEEEIVIVGGGIGGLCFAAALHRYDVIPYSSNYHDLMLI
jgi:NADH dehydrogenase FAD-containing subunit